MAARKRVGGKCLRAERGECRRAAQMRLRLFGGGNELAVRRECRDGLIVAGE